MHKVFPLGSEGNLHQSALNMIGKAKCHFAMTCALQRSFEDHISPPGAAAQICAATPILVDLLGSVLEPEVDLRQEGLLGCVYTSQVI